MNKERIKKCPECGSNSMQIMIIACKTTQYIGGKSLGGSNYRIAEKRLQCLDCTFEKIL